MWAANVSLRHSRSNALSIRTTIRLQIPLHFYIVLVCLFVYSMLVFYCTRLNCTFLSLFFFVVVVFTKHNTTDSHLWHCNQTYTYFWGKHIQKICSKCKCRHVNTEIERETGRECEQLELSFGNWKFNKRILSVLYCAASVWVRCNRERNCRMR